jgi:hypothetical protein
VDQDEHKKIGRPKGAVGKRTTEFLSVLEKNNFNVAQALVDCYQKAIKTYDNYGVIYDAICDAKAEKEGWSAPVEDHAHKYLKIAVDVAKDLASYSYPKLKAMEMAPLVDQSIKAEQASELLKMDDQEMLKFMRERLALIAANQPTNE